MLHGDAPVELLDEYEAQRRTVALRNAGQAELRSDFEPRFGIRTAAGAGGRLGHAGLIAHVRVNRY